MILEVYSVMDKAVKAFLPPFFVRSKGEAIRSFSDACNDGKHQFAVHSADYLLVYLGTFDDSNGLIVGVEPQRVISATECTFVRAGGAVSNGGGAQPPGDPHAEELIVNKLQR